MIKKSPYDVLGLSGDFEYRDIKKAYRVSIKKYPPEKNPERFKEISDAYDILSNENYFIGHVMADLSVVDVDIEIAQDEVDNAKYLKEIFEVPFKI